jgi:hypothetical protein
MAVRGIPWEMVLTGGLDAPNGGTMYHLNNNIIVSEFFVDSNSISSNRIKEWDGTNWTVISPANHNGIRSIITYSNELYAGGRFDPYTIVLMKYGFVNGFEENKISRDFFITPNPVVDHLSIISFFNKGEIKIYNLSGEKVFEKVIINSKIEIDISNLPIGFYFIKVSDGENVAVKRFVKM